MKKRVAIVFIYSFLISILSWAHGEDKPGPHGGFIKMPGAFHTEVVLSGPQQLTIYLLDMNWKNPSVTRSKLQVTYKSDKTSIGQCEVKDSHYVCLWPKTVNLNHKAQLLIEAQRLGQKGNLVSYDLPLSFPNRSNDHSGHH